MAVEGTRGQLKADDGNLRHMKAKKDQKDHLSGGYMKLVYIFGRPDCSVCKDAVHKVNYFKEKGKFQAEIKYFDMESVDGLAEGSFLEVSDIPTIVIMNEGEEIMRWVKKPPISEEFLPYLT